MTAKSAKATPAKSAKAAPAPAEATSTVQTEAKPKLVEVVAAKAFLGPNGWVQKGQKAQVTPDRKKDLARNGLIEGAAADGAGGSAAQTSAPLDAPGQTSRRLNVGAQA